MTLRLCVRVTVLYNVQYVGTVHFESSRSPCKVAVMKWLIRLWKSRNNVNREIGGNVLKLFGLLIDLIKLFKK